MEHSIGLYILVFVIASLIIGSLTMIITKGTKLPYTVALLLIGLGLGGIERTGFFKENLLMISETIELVSKVDPHLILFIFLPTLIFESAYSLEVHLFKRIFSQIATLAVPGLIISTVATAVLAKFLFPWHWEWELALLFGALISATDPVAVVALLKEVSSRKRLETLIEGESLLNDGTAIVLFTLFFAMLTSTSGSEFSLLGVVGSFSFVVALGLVIGVVLGYLAIFIISKVFNNPLVEITLSVGVAYLVFFVAEHTFHVSGVVALVALALMFSSIGRTKVSPEVSGFLHQFWEMMAHFANTFIFLLVGVLIATRVKLDVAEYWTALIVLYVGITIIRSGSVAVLMPFLKRISIGFTKEKAIVLVWGGLRGAVSLALALTIAQSDIIPKEIGDQVLFLTAGIVVMTILINGLTMESLLGKLGLDKLPPGKEATVKKAEMNVYDELLRMLPELKSNDLLQNAQWETINEMSELNKFILENNNNNKEISEEELNIEFRRRLLENERKFYWSEFKKGSLGATATVILSEAVEEALDEYPTITPRPRIEKIWHIPKIMHIFKDIPILGKLALKLSFDRLALGYEVARGFMSAQDEVLSHIEALGHTQDEIDSVREDISKNKQMTYDFMLNLNNIFPEMVCAIQTKTAKRLLYNKERCVIEKLLDSGVLDKPEARKMIDAIEAKMFLLLKFPIAIEPPDTKSLLEQSAWAQKLKENTIDQIVKVSKNEVYAKDEIILKQFEKSKFIVIIARGSAEIIDEEKDIVENIVGRGSILGVDSIISGKNDRTVKATTPVDVLYISEADIRIIMQSDTNFIENIAKYKS